MHTTRTISSLLLCGMLTFGSLHHAFAASAPDPVPVDPDAIDAGCSMKGAYQRSMLFRGAPDPPSDRLDRALDVVHYELALDVTDTSHVVTNVETNTYFPRVFLRGTLEATVIPLETTDRIVLDLDNVGATGTGLTVLGATADGSDFGYTHTADTLTVNVGRTLVPGDTTRVWVSFEGTPTRGSSVGYGLRASWFRTPNYEGIGVDYTQPIIGTLSQPVSARTWWPCHDHPADAATVRLTVRTFEDWEVAAPGLLERDEIVAPGFREQTHFMPTPIPSYLVSLATGRFERWSDSVELLELMEDGSEVSRTVPLDYYAPSTLEAEARNSWTNTGAILQTFEEWFGPYPYADIKYGNALFSFGGAMEHPSMSSIGDGSVGAGQSVRYPGPVGEMINAHEVAHQWFGNCVRLERWGDIWLNEGVARYCEFLWLEEAYGPTFAREFLDRLRLDSFGGTLRDPGPSQMFGATVYSKGAWTMHQLRQVLGRDGLLAAMRNFVTDPELRFTAVTVEDFQAHCEAVYGEALDWYFDPWQNRSGRPRLTVTWEQTGTTLGVQVSQPADRVYRLPLPLRIHFADGSSEDIVQWVGESGSTTTLELQYSASIAQVLVDPDRNWLLDIERPGLAPVRLSAVLPNPFNPSATVSFVVEVPTEVAVVVYDTRGRSVRKLNRSAFEPGQHTLVWDGADDDGEILASGVYIVRLVGGGVEDSKRVTLLK